MNFSKFQLIVSDLDGTLVKSGSSGVSLAVKQAISDLSAHGIQFTIATGRSWGETKPIVEALNVTLPVILESGAVVMNPVTETIMNFKPLRSTIIENMDSFNHDSDYDCFRLSEFGIFYYDTVTTIEGQWLTGKRKCQMHQPHDEGKSEKFIKYLYIGSHELLRNMAAEFTRRIQPAPYIVLWPPEPNGECFMEVFDSEVSKGKALKWLVNALSIDLSDILAFGDSYNDLDMLQFAGLGVTIHGASAELISKADIIIPGPQEDGVARFLNGELKKAI